MVERDHMEKRDREGPPEIALVGDLTEHQSELCEKFLEVDPGGECILYIDSLGGSPYTATALLSLASARRRRCGRSPPARSGSSPCTACCCSIR